MQRTTAQNLRASRVELENILRTVEEALEEAGESLDDEDSDEPDAVSADVISALRADVMAEIGSIRSALKDIPDGAVLGAIKKLTDKVSMMETSIRQVTTWEASARESADRMASVASSLVALDRVRDYSARSVCVVKHKNAPSGDYVAIFSGDATGMAMAKELAAAARVKGYIICLGIWQGAVKIGDAVE